MTQANYALRLQASLKAEAERLAKAEGTTLNQFINVAVAEKIAALRTADFFRERARRADLPAALALLDRLGNDNPPRRPVGWLEPHVVLHCGSSAPEMHAGNAGGVQISRGTGQSWGVGGSASSPTSSRASHASASAAVTCRPEA